ncbi:hypothetical protein CKO_05003 [Citrobacter koseri ATCC BAA-895]|uniref:Uncharacterized protein n=1 Tax=Citrobacter koseri (strain ATCC BAA-895 / CDC 4225-83 / SGSC4696) TaxID=290338 RepID=A8ARD3_CITK8|nr:hypothetical protein CKO_05003 [Citrobacter koseri ATCC BAA-895]
MTAYLLCRSMLLTNLRVFPGIFFMFARHNQPPPSLWRKNKKVIKELR